VECDFGVGPGGLTDLAPEVPFDKSGRGHRWVICRFNPKSIGCKLTELRQDRHTRNIDTQDTQNAYGSANDSQSSLSRCRHWTISIKPDAEGPRRSGEVQKVKRFAKLLISGNDSARRNKLVQAALEVGVHVYYAQLGR
jgi:hypothetical protein